MKISECGKCDYRPDNYLWPYPPRWNPLMVADPQGRYRPRASLWPHPPQRNRHMGEGSLRTHTAVSNPYASRSCGTAGFLRFDLPDTRQARGFLGGKRGFKFPLVNRSGHGTSRANYPDGFDLRISSTTTIWKFLPEENPKKFPKSVRKRLSRGGCREFRHGPGLFAVKFASRPPAGHRAAG